MEGACPIKVDREEHGSGCVAYVQMPTLSRCRRFIVLSEGAEGLERFHMRLIQVGDFKPLPIAEYL